jgi:hypothetical protein
VPSVGRIVLQHDLPEMAMFRQRVFSCAALFVLVVASLLAATAFAQGVPGPDTREINAYVLTEAALARYSQATRNLGALAKQLSSNCDDDDGGSGSIGQSVARIDAIAGAKAAIQSAGMATREYIVFGMSVFQAGLSAWALTQPGGKLPAGVSRANVDFYRTHEKAINALGAPSQASDCNSNEDRE